MSWPCKRVPLIKAGCTLYDKKEKLINLFLTKSKAQVGYDLCRFSKTYTIMKTSILLKFYISKSSAAFQMGALLEDYISDVNKHLYSDDILEGYEHQRCITSNLLTHPAYKKSEMLLDRKLRKSADKIIPMFFDHFLRKNWEQYSDVPFEQFIKELNAGFNSNGSIMPDKYVRLLTAIDEQDWYKAIQTVGGTHAVMMQQTKRYTPHTSLEPSMHNLIEHYTEHRDNFVEVMTDLIKASDYFVASKREYLCA
jgi:acyl carrier protein phosphodiesterase